MSRSATRAALATLVVPFVAAGVALGAASSASAATFTVSDPTDDATTPNTLRWAMAQASADGEAPVIDIAPGLAIDLTCAGGGELLYGNGAGHPLTIIGNGATVTQTCAGDAVVASASEDLAIHDLVVRGGRAGGIVGGGDVRIEDSTVEESSGGPGVSAYTGTATIVRSTVRANAGSAGGGVGAIHVVVDRSTLEGNSGTNGGGAWADQSMTIVNSTVTGNTATGSGGGIYAGLDTIDLAHATIVANQAPTGANVHLDVASQIMSFASIITTPMGGGADCDIDAGATVVSVGANLTSDGSCGFAGGPGDLVVADPQVGALADNGGPTRTRLPAPTSPALDRADCSAGAVTGDQRGVSRPQGAACDAGAVEVEVPDAPAPPDPSTVPPAGPATAVATRPTFTG